MSESTQLPSIQRIKRDGIEEYRPFYFVGTFSCFADNSFNPNKFTSDIIVENGKDGQVMDLDMCLKMLSMYLETIETDLREVVLQNQDCLFNQISDIKELKTKYSVIDNRVSDITSSFESIKSEVNSSCKSINENAVRLANFNAVVSLLRQISTFRLGIKKIKGFLVDENPSQRAWLRAQKTYQEIEKAFVEGHLSSNTTSFFVIY